MGTKTVKYNKQGIAQLPNDKPVLYRIETESGNPRYSRCCSKGKGPGENLRNIWVKFPERRYRIEQFSMISTTPRRKRLT